MTSPKAPASKTAGERGYIPEPANVQRQSTNESPSGPSEEDNLGWTDSLRIGGSEVLR